MLDTSRVFKAEVLPATKTVAGVECRTIRVTDEKDPTYIPLEVSLHPELEMPYDNWEVLFLLKIIGEKLSQFLHERTALFDRVPMEMHIDLAAGGKLDTKVVSVKKMLRTAFDPQSRPLGNPFVVPPGYAPPPKKLGPAAPVEPPKPGKAD
jgi:hypothetical protein